MEKEFQVLNDIVKNAPVGMRTKTSFTGLSKELKIPKTELNSILNKLEMNHYIDQCIMVNHDSFDLILTQRGFSKAFKLDETIKPKKA